MNDVKSLVCRGFLPAAFAAALLPAASGTASAQVTVGFVETSGTVAENASPGADTPDLLEATVRVTGLPAAGDPARGDAVRSMLGTITITNSASGVATVPSDPLDFSTRDEAVVTVTPVDDDDFKDGRTFLELASTVNLLDPNPAVFTVTVEDDEVAPVLAFSDSTGARKTRTGVGEGVSGSVRIGIYPGAEGASIPTAALATLTNVKPKLMVSPAGEVTKSSCPDSSSSDFGKYAVQFEVSGSGSLVDGVMELRKNFSAYESAHEETLNITGCADGDDFRDAMIMVDFEPESLDTDVGVIGSVPLLVIVPSDEEAPEVSFASTRLLVDEGGQATVAIVAQGALAREVGTVDLKVSGNARIALQQGGEDIDANADGNYTVDFGGGTNAVVTISATEDETLAEGGTRTATITFADSRGAGVGNRDAVEVTVRGVTAVPALPLVGQLLLGLLLLAGGARLRRRRQG